MGYEEKKLIQAHLTLSCLTFVISEVGGCHAILAEKDGRYAMQCTKFFQRRDRQGRHAISSDVAYRQPLSRVSFTDKMAKWDRSCGQAQEKLLCAMLKDADCIYMHL